MAVARHISEQEYAAFVLSGASGVWELRDGRLVQKPAMGGDRGRVVSALTRQLLPQLDPSEYEVRVDDGRVRHAGDTILIPDLLIVPAADRASALGTAGLVIYGKPLPLVIEVWSPPSDGYDVDAKLPLYRERGDLEIWRLHPTERTLTTWVRQGDGTYAETIYQAGGGLPTALRGVQLHRTTRFDA